MAAIDTMSSIQHTWLDHGGLMVERPAFSTAGTVHTVHRMVPLGSVLLHTEGNTGASTVWGEGFS